MKVSMTREVAAAGLEEGGEIAIKDKVIFMY